MDLRRNSVETFTALLILCVVGWTLLLPTAILLLLARRRADRERRALLDEFKATISVVTDSAQGSITMQAKQLSLLEKNFAQLRASNAWEYQAIMSMSGGVLYDENYDPSPEAEAERIAERQNKKDELDDSLTAEEEAFLSDLLPGLG